MFENQQFEQSVMVTRPDSNTAEAIAYGDEYTFIKSATWWWDALEDELNRQLKEEMGKIRDPEFAAYVVRNRPNMIWSRRPPVNEPDKQKDLIQLREIIKRGTALRDLNVRRTKNEMYARLKGVDKHVKEVREKGSISETQWMAATSGRNERIDYEMLRELLDDDRLKAEQDAEQMELGIKEYNEAKEKFAREYDAWKKAKDEEMDPNKAMERQDEEESAKDPFDISELPIFKEAEKAIGEMEKKAKDEGEDVDPTSEDYWKSESPEEEEVEPRRTHNWVSGPVHDRVHHELNGFYLDDMDWFLTEVCA